MMRKRISRKHEEGFTLMETLMAAALMAIAFSVIMPAYISLTSYVTNNRQHAEGYTLAAREMERIRASTYIDVGLIGGNPAGVFQPDRNETGPNGGTYHIAVRIWWIDDPMDGTAAAGTDPMPNDYKQARVTVTKPGSTDVLAQLTSNIARESEEPPITGGNIIVKVLLSDGITPVTDVRVNVTTGPSSPLTGWTNDEGVSLFAELTPSVTSGDYTISVEKSGYVVRVDQTTLTTTVIFGQTRTVTFILDQPGQLTVRLVDPGGVEIQTTSTLTLSNAEIGDVIFDAATGYFDFPSLFPGNYDITALAAGYYATPTPTSVVVERSQSTTVNITLQPLPTGRLVLHVYDATTHLKLGVTDVRLTNQSNNQVLNTQTNSSGDLEIDLEIAVYTVVVTAAGYQPYSTTATITEGGTTTVDANLEGYPTTGSIRVRAETRSHTPRSGVDIRVVGQGYDQHGLTGSSGEIIFDYLVPGEYSVYRWGGSGWRQARYVTVTAGNEEYVVYSW